jgi:hypothetical protein
MSTQKAFHSKTEVVCRRHLNLGFIRELAFGLCHKSVASLRRFNDLGPRQRISTYNCIQPYCQLRCVAWVMS